MGFTDEQYRTIKCDGPGCPKEVRFDLKDVKAIQAIDWLKGVRVIQTGDNRAFSYCSDVCEVKAVTTGKHNLIEKLEPPKIIPTATEGDVKAAAAQVEGEAKLTEALQTGEGEALVKLS
jgi:hypothetical protein